MSFVNKENITSIIQGSNGVKDAINQKANADGYYVTLTAGSSEQLLSTVSINDKVPYNFRTAGGSADIGDRLTDKIVGGTVAWNQLVQNGNFANANGWSASGGTLSVANGVATFTASGGDRRFGRGVYFTKGHKYLISAQVKTATETDKICLQSANSALAGTYTVPSVDWQTIQRMYVRSGDTQNVNIGIKDMRESDWDAVQVKNIQVFDLTQMFGSTIADRIYSLEQSTAGAGTAWFKSLFPKDYYSYNAGEMLSVNVSSHDTVSFNQLSYAPTYYKASTTFDITKVTRVIPGQRYQLSFDGIAGATSWRVGYRFYDLNGTYFGSTSIKPFSEYQRELGTSVPYYNSGNSMYTEGSDGASLSRYMTFAQECYVKIYFVNGDTSSSMSMTNPCFHFVWDGEKDGEFEEYIKHSYQLDSSLELRGIPRLDTNNKLYYNGDIYESDGTVTKRYGIVDLGTLNWIKATMYGTGTVYYHVAFTVCKSGTINMITPKYTTIWTGAVATQPDKSIWRRYGATNGINIRDDAYAESSAADFKAALSGVYLVYELQTPTTESAAPFTNPQIIDDFGTEEYIDYAYSQGTRDVAIPVGHDTLYMNNLRAKLEMSPDSPDGDGDYIVRQSGGENTYVPLTKELPTAPSEDGNYVLKVTVVDGTPTYSWEAQT